MVKEQFRNFYEKLSKLLGSVALLAIGLVVGISSERCSKKEQPQMRTLSTTSVSVNDRGEMIMMDRKDGSYVMYSDSVGMVIFDLYSNLIVE